MIEFPEFREKAKIGELEFEIMDLSISFFDKTDKDSEHYNDTEILRDATTLSEDEIQSLGNREKLKIVEKILDITNPNRHDKSEENEDTKK